MRIVPQHIAALPKLAWLAEVPEQGSEVKLLHGSWVEVRERFFVEGVWDGAFADAAFAHTENFFGSGAVVKGQAIHFVSSLATTDYLYYRHLGTALVVSNSLCFLLAYTHDELDVRKADYEAISESIALGIDVYRRVIPTVQAAVIRLMYRNLVFERGSLAIVDKPLPPHFATFESYYAYLRETYRRLAQNARDTERNRQLLIYSTQSSGYDSTAVNAVAAAAGVDQVFTHPRSKARDSFFDSQDRSEEHDDDGSEIAAALGLPCTPIDRLDFLGDASSEYLYHATLTNCSDLNFVGLLQQISAPTMLLTGTLGEMWYPLAFYRDRWGTDQIAGDLRRGDLGCHGLTEARLSQGAIHAPIIYIGARRQADLVAITDSAAMEPWRLHVAYDRPIPRRIGEQAGVPRSAFGQQKRAVVVSLARPNLPQEPSLRGSYLSYLDEHRLLHRWMVNFLPLVHRINNVIWHASPTRYRLVYYLHRLSQRVRGKDFPLLWSRLISALHCFCAQQRAADYARAIAQIQRPREAPHYEDIEAKRASA